MAPGDDAKGASNWIAPDDNAKGALIGWHLVMMLKEPLIRLYLLIVQKESLHDNLLK